MSNVLAFPASPKARAQKASCLWAMGEHSLDQLATKPANVERFASHRAKVQAPEYGELGFLLAASIFTKLPKHSRERLLADFRVIEKMHRSDTCATALLDWLDAGRRK